MSMFHGLLRFWSWLRGRRLGTPKPRRIEQIRLTLNQLASCQLADNRVPLQASPRRYLAVFDSGRCRATRPGCAVSGLFGWCGAERSTGHLVLAAAEASTLGQLPWCLVNSVARRPCLNGLAPILLWPTADSVTQTLLQNCSVDCRSFPDSALGSWRPVARSQKVCLC